MHTKKENFTWVIIFFERGVRGKGKVEGVMGEKNLTPRVIWGSQWKKSSDHNQMGVEKWFKGKAAKPPEKYCSWE